MRFSLFISTALCLLGVTEANPSKCVQNPCFSAVAIQKAQLRNPNVLTRLADCSAIVFAPSVTGRALPGAARDQTPATVTFLTVYTKVKPRSGGDAPMDKRSGGDAPEKRDSEPKLPYYAADYCDATTDYISACSCLGVRAVETAKAAVELVRARNEAD